MSRLGKVLVALVSFSVVNTFFAFLNVMFFGRHDPYGSVASGQIFTMGGTTAQPILLVLQLAVQFLSAHSLILAPTSWLLVGGVWTWRGRIRSKWEKMGFDSEIFQLFIKMRGGRSRLRMLNALDQPKDRYQLAKELGMDWRAIDQHLMVLTRRGLVSDEVVYGKVRVYHLTPSGKLLLNLLGDIDVEAGKTPNTELQMN